MTHITLGGDVMLGRSFNDIFQTNPDFNPWGNLLPSLYETDLFGVNLETAVTDSLVKWPNKAFNYRLSPRYSSVLSPISYCSLANNHILDYLPEGMYDTIETLDYLGIKHAGAGENLSSAKSAAYLNNLTFISAADHYDYWAAGPDRPGIWYVDVAKGDYGSVLSYIERIRDPRKTLIFSLHWGSNWEPEVSPERKRFAYDLCRSGVNIIHGHSSHHIQPIEDINGNIVFYGFGDLVDDYAIDEDFRSDLSFLAAIQIDNNKISDIVIRPTQIASYQVNYLHPDEEGYSWVKEKVSSSV